MASNYLTLNDITRSFQRELHQRLNFVTNCVTEYDNSFANEGAQIGDSVRIRLPMMYNTGTGPTMTTGTGADSLQNAVTLQLTTQRHVPMRFTSKEMTLDIEDFANRHVRPAAAKLAAMVESDCLSTVMPYVAQYVAGGTKVELADVLTGKVQLGNSLADTANRYALLNTQAAADMLTDTKGLFQDSQSIATQYKEGMLGRIAGFDFYENTLLQNYTSGVEGGGSAYLCNQVAAQVGSYTSPNSMSLIVDTGTKTVTAGSVFNISGVYDVHPETKVSTGVLKKFSVVTGFTGAGTITISPALIASGPYKNASTGAANNKKLLFLEAAASTAYHTSLLFQKGFAAFATADLVLPPNQKASRVVKDGISIRLIHEAYDAVKDRLYTRLDVLYGIKVLRPQLACKIRDT